ncbi:MAG: UMP kinase, partial [Thermoplasmata archaeon]|nr:UMP kinase [Thermoplasmata archaeon]
MKAVVISFGGSLIDTENGSDFLKRFSEMIGETSKDYRVFIVVGGGRVAREYIRLGRAMDIKEQLLDEIGIAATRLNASLVSSLLGANKKIPTTTSDAAKMEGRII